jgi:hypothetical protein
VLALEVGACGGEGGLLTLHGRDADDGGSGVGRGVVQVVDGGEPRGVGVERSGLGSSEGSRSAGRVDGEESCGRRRCETAARTKLVRSHRLESMEMVRKSRRTVESERERSSIVRSEVLDLHDGSDEVWAGDLDRVRPHADLVGLYHQQCDRAQDRPIFSLRRRYKT